MSTAYDDMKAEIEKLKAEVQEYRTDYLGAMDEIGKLKVKLAEAGQNSVDLAMRNANLLANYVEMKGKAEHYQKECMDARRRMDDVLSNPKNLPFPLPVADKAFGNYQRNLQAIFAKLTKIEGIKLVRALSGNMLSECAKWYEGYIEDKDLTDQSS